MNFVARGDFVLRSGNKSGYKFECDALTGADWEGVAAAVMEELGLPPFQHAVGVPRGGVPLARAMNRHACPGDSSLPFLVCEDVVTTGASMERFREECFKDEHVVGVAFICRGSCPDWVRPLLTLNRWGR